MLAVTDNREACSELPICRQLVQTSLLQLAQFLQPALPGLVAQSMAMAQVDFLCWGDAATLTRPCVDCGLLTGRFCDFCLASLRIPDEQWADGQATPLCSTCDNRHGACHFCRGLTWCMPAPHASTEPASSCSPAAS